MDGGAARMNVAIIELKFNKPIEWLDSVPGMLPDPGGYVYRIYHEDGRKHIAGTSRGTDEERAMKRALSVASQAGYTHYRMMGEAGDPKPTTVEERQERPDPADDELSHHAHKPR